MEKKYSLKFVLTLMFSTLALTSLVLGLLFYFYFQTPDKDRVNTDELDELLDVISTRFIGQYDVDELLEFAKRAIVDALDDDWTFYMNPEEYSDFLQNSDNRYHGIGVEVTLDDEFGGIRVRNVYRNSGAFNAGVLAGDVIVAIDGESIRGLDLTEIRTLLRRELDSIALITVLRDDIDLHDLTVLYSIVFTDPVEFQMLDGNIGYISLRNFEYGAASSFIDAVEALVKEGAVAFIYDVRSNNGGKVNEMTDILDFLLPEGEIFIAVSREGYERITMSDANFIDKPAVVLVNTFSFSGAEYFAAMLSEYEYAHTVGEQTTGKNRMQTTLRMTNGSAVHISTGEYLTKNRVSLYDIGGFTPDFIIPLTDDEFRLFIMGELDFGDDPQLQKALSLLKD
ncbi:MAG: S41 family peptidase [Oscillospiraceae bacterium]|nr:S41 family peptidase [Oscillospiraceae bacterium]